MGTVVTERQRKFAVAYSRLANATRAAIEAGYSVKSAPTTGSQLIRNPQVQALIESSRVRRDVHADQTYQQLIAIANASMKLANESLNDPGVTNRERLLMLEGAGRQVERVARCEGLMVEIPTRPDEGRMTLQSLAQKLRKGVEFVQTAPAKVELREVSATVIESREVVLPAPQVEDPKNGNGHAA